MVFNKDVYQEIFILLEIKMTFEEEQEEFKKQFPSLKDKDHDFIGGEHYSSDECANGGEWFTREDIQENCLDKQRANKILKPLWDVHGYLREVSYDGDIKFAADTLKLRDNIYDCIEDIKKELDCD